MNKYFDTKYVWHCDNRHKPICTINHYICRGDKCKHYKPTPGSVNDKSLRKVEK